MWFITDDIICFNNYYYRYYYFYYYYYVSDVRHCFTALVRHSVGTAKKNKQTVRFAFCSGFFLSSYTYYLYGKRNGEKNDVSDTEIRPGWRTTLNGNNMTTTVLLIVPRFLYSRWSIAVGRSRLVAFFIP